MTENELSKFVFEAGLKVHKLITLRPLRLNLCALCG